MALSGWASSEQFRLVGLHQQVVDRQALHVLVGALHHLLIPLISRIAQVFIGGLALADLGKGVASEVAAAIEDQTNAADASSPSEVVRRRPRLNAAP